MLLLFAAVDDVVSEGGRQASSTPVPTPSPPSAIGTASRGEGAPGREGLRHPAACASQADAPPRPPLRAGAGQAAAAAGEEAEPAPSLEELMAELDGLCGLDKVKADVKSLINLVKVRRLRQEHGLPVPP